MDPNLSLGALLPPDGPPPPTWSPCPLVFINILLQVTQTTLPKTHIIFVIHLVPMSWQRWHNVNITVGQVPWRDFNEVETAGWEVQSLNFSTTFQFYIKCNGFLMIIPIGFGCKSCWIFYTGIISNSLSPMLALWGVADCSLVQFVCWLKEHEEYSLILLLFINACSPWGQKLKAAWPGMRSIHFINIKVILL